jgi:hypothetical protein
VDFRGCCSESGRGWYILWPFGLFYGHLIYFVDFIVIWYIFPFLVCCTKKNLATLIEARPLFQCNRHWRIPSRPGGGSNDCTLTTKGEKNLASHFEKIGSQLTAVID